MNKVILMGRLTRDPEVRYTDGPEPMAISRFILAVDRRYKRDGDQQTADFINCVAFGRTGEFIERYCQKGIKLMVEGRIQTGSYTNKDGAKVYTTDVVVENAEFAESKAVNKENNNAGNNKTGSRKPDMDADGFMQIPDGVEDGLPFLD